MELPTMHKHRSGFARSIDKGQSRSAPSGPAGARRNQMLMLGLSIGLAFGVIACTQPASTTAPAGTTAPAATSGTAPTTAPTSGY